MARDKEFESRMQGMAYAYEIAKKRVYQALKKRLSAGT